METLNAVFTWLLRASWQASVLVGLVLLTQWLFRKKLSPGWRYALWLLVLARLVMPVSPQSPVSIFNLTRITSPVPLHSTIPPSSVLTPPLPTSGSTVESARESGPLRVGASTTKSAGGSRAPTLAAAHDPTSAAPITHHASRVTLPPLPTSLPFLWLTGVCLLALRMAWQNTRFARRVLKQRQVTNSAALDALEDCKQCMNLRTPLTVIETTEVKSPALYGFVRPRLVLPQGTLAAFTPQELHYIFLHELAHVKRCDMAVNWLISGLRVLHWFNPILWFGFRRMAADREVATDALALSHAPERGQQPYGQTIIKLLESFTRPTAMAGLVGILEDKQQMKKRISMIAQFKKSVGWSVLAPVLVLLLALVSLTDAQTEKKLAPSFEAASLPVHPSLTFRKLTEPSSDFGLRQISSDGHTFVGTAKTSLGSPLVLNLITGAQRRYEIKTTSFKLSPDGTQIAAGLRDPDHWPRTLGVVDTASGNVREIYRCESQKSSLHVADWSPDGKRILVEFFETGMPAKIALISASDGSWKVLKVFGNRLFPSGSTFSPDGRWIVFNSNEGTMGQKLDIHVLAADGSSDTPLVQHPANDQVLGWAPFGDRVLLASDRRGSWDSYTLKVTDGKAVDEPVLIKKDIGKVAPLGFKKDGAFVYLSNTETSDVYMAALDPVSGRVQEKPSKVTRVEGRNRYPAWSRDGRFLAYISSPYDSSIPGGDLPNGVICIRDLQTGTVRELSSDAGRLAFPQWMPDGRSFFALGARNGRGFAYRIDLDSGKSTVIAEDMGVPFNTWCIWLAPDGKSVYQQTGVRSVTRRDFVTNVKKEFSIPRNLFSTVLSPSGEYFAFSVTATNSGSFTRTINVMPVSGGDARSLVELVGAESLMQPHAPDAALGWTSDSRHVLFVKGNSTNPKMRSLWRVPLAGGEPEALGLEMDELREPVISPDGRRIAFTAGGTKTEVWVMENFLPKEKLAAK